MIFFTFKNIFSTCTCICFTLSVLKIHNACTCRCVIHSCFFVSADGEQELKLHILDIEVPYYNEYLGCQQLPVFSPRTDAYFISLTQVQIQECHYNTCTQYTVYHILCTCTGLFNMIVFQALQNGKSSCIALPQGSNKTELLKVHGVYVQD